MIHVGTQVRIKTPDEIAEIIGITVDDLRSRGDGRIEGTYWWDRSTVDFAGNLAFVNEIDDGDGAVLLVDYDLWIEPEFLEALSEPDFWFGFRVGDYVEVKSWKEMKEDGSIHYNGFAEGMRGLCGGFGTIISIQDFNRKCAKIGIDFDSNAANRWYYTTGMVKHAEPEPLVELDEAKLMQLLELT